MFIKLETCEDLAGKAPLTAPVGRRPRTKSFFDCTGDKTADETGRMATYCSEFDFGAPVPAAAAAAERSAADLWAENQGLMEEVESLREDSLSLTQINAELSRTNAEFARERNRLLAELSAARASAVKPETSEMGVNTDPSCLSATIVIRPGIGTGARVLGTGLRLPRAGAMVAVVFGDFTRASSPVPVGAAARARRASREELSS